ncbi:MAG: heme-degrading domain-containing protein [Terrimicrobiaceae bacterium]
MDIDEDLRRIALQEERLQFDHFDSATAWDLGKRLKEIAETRHFAIVIDIQLLELPLFYLALPGTTPDNPDWVRRKRNIVRRFFRSSYAIGLMVRQQKANLEALDPRDYAPHGGSFPILLPGTGCVGTITVSGLPQRQDHCLVVETVAELLGRDLSDIALA